VDDHCFPACCAFEFIATASFPLRYFAVRYGNYAGFTPVQADLMITARDLTWKMAPQVKRIYEQMAEPKWSSPWAPAGCSGGIFANSYAVVPGY